MLRNCLLEIFDEEFLERKEKDNAKWPEYLAKLFLTQL